MSYTAPNWVNGQAPALNAENLNALCQAVQAMGNGLVVTLPYSLTLSAGEFVTTASGGGVQAAAYGDYFFGKVLGVDSVSGTAEVQVGGYYTDIPYHSSASIPAPAIGYNNVVVQSGKIKTSNSSVDQLTGIIVTRLDTTNKVVDFILTNNFTFPA